jgi:hypothetical protein
VSVQKVPVVQRLGPPKLGPSGATTYCSGAQLACPATTVLPVTQTGSPHDWLA